MALPINSIWEIRTGATAANANGCGFNPENGNMMTDLATTGSTGQGTAPTVSSATYTFVAGDVDGYLFVKAGTSWTPGWYLIASVAGGVATLTATIGSVVKYTSGAARSFAVNTVAGVGTADDLTGGTFTIDYSQQNAAELNVTDGASTASTTFTSAGSTFRQSMIGNFGHLISATGADEVVGWYEIVNWTDANTIVLDRTSGTYTVCVFNIGGAASLQSSTANQTDDIFFELGAGTNGSGAHVFFIQNGTFASVQAVSVAATGGTQVPIRVCGYNTIRTDGMTGSLGANRPIWGGSPSFGTNWDIYNISFLSNAVATLTVGSQGKVLYCKAICNSTTAARSAIQNGNNTVFFLGVEAMSYRGPTWVPASAGSTLVMDSCYFHDSTYFVNAGTTTGRHTVTNCLFADFITTIWNNTSAATGAPSFLNNTFYGVETKAGTGFAFITASLSHFFRNCIFYGLTTPINNTDPQLISLGLSDYNDYYNNTNGNTNFPAGKNDIAVDPAFTSVAQRTGSTATTNTTGGNHLVDTNATFQTWGIVAGTDILHITGGTAGPVVCAYSILSVDSETQLTVGETIVANATADHTWHITYGHNFLPTGNV